MNDIILDDWQNEVLKYNGDFLICTGRRVGKTQIMAIKAAEKMIMEDGTQIVVVSLTEDQAKLIIVMILDYIERHAPKTIDKKAKNKPTQNRIMLKNHSSVIARPVGNTGDAVRGFNGNVLIIDEASRMPELVWAAAKPILLTTGGQIWMCSTPNGKQGYFWDMFDEAYNQKAPDARFKVFYKSSEDVIYNRKISESWSEKQREKAIALLEKEKKDMSQIEYGQEYMGLFMEDLNRFIDDDIIEAICTGKRPEIMPDGKNYMGCDLAREGGDEITHEIVNDAGSKFIQVENVVNVHQKTPEVERDILALAQIWNVRKIGLDAGAGTLGVSILDHLMETKVKHKLIAMNNRDVSLDDEKEETQKLAGEDMYFNLRSMMEHGECQFLDDENLKLSLRSLQMEYVKTPTQKTRVRIFGRYSHIAEGLKRALWLARKEKALNLYAY